MKEYTKSIKKEALKHSNFNFWKCKGECTDLILWLQAVRATFVSTYTDPAKRIVNDNVNIGLAMGVVLLKVSFVADVSKCYTAYFAEVYEGFETNLTWAVGMVINVFLYIYVLRRQKVVHYLL